MRIMVSMLVASLVAAQATVQAAATGYPERWNYARAELGSDKGLDAFLDVLRQSKEVGCTHIQMVEGRWFRTPNDPGYLGRVAKVRAYAKENGLTLVPCVYSLGYSGRYLGLDPNLCAGLPVRDMPFVVHGGKAVADPALAVNVSGVKAVDSRMSGTVKLRPFTHYRITFSSPAELPGDAEEWLRVAGKVGSRWLNRRDLDSRREGGRHLFETTFNSLEAEEASVRIGAVVQDLKIEPAGLLMVVRRALCPLKVTSADGQTVYQEGRDFQPVVDPKLRTDGEFVATHEAPAIQLAADSRIKDGDTLRVSFFHAYRMGSDQDVISMEDPKVFEIMEQDMANCAKVWQAEGYFMNYDEIRIGGWETPDRKPGQILADHVKKGYEIVRRHAPQAKIYTWSDMFTPFHNARPFSVKGYYYLVNGNWDGAWEGLSKDVIIMNWYAKERPAVQFFSDRGHKQVICGYYDGTTTEKMKNNIAGWMKVTEGAPNILGFMYTTWRKNYKNLKEYFGLLDTFPQWGQAATAAPSSKIPGATD